MKVVVYYLQIAEDLKQKIKSGEFKPGSRLTTEMALVKQWGVSRQTVRNALAELENENLIYRIPSKGTFVNGHSETSTLYQNWKGKREVMKLATKTIGVLIPCITISLYPGIVRGVEDIAQENDWQTVLANYDVSPDKETNYLSMFVQRRVKGIVAAPSFNSQPEPYLKLLESGIPLVLVDVRVPQVAADLVTTDNIEGGYLATETLLREGCKKVAFIGEAQNTLTFEERHLGYRQVLGESGFMYEESLTKDGLTPESAHQLAGELIRCGVDGIFVANECNAVAVMQAVRDSGRDVKVVSFDEPRIPPDLPHPIAFVAQRRNEIGQAAGKLLLERIKEKDVKKPIRKINIAPAPVQFFCEAPVLQAVSY